MNILKQQILNTLIDDERVPHTVVQDIADILEAKTAQLGCLLSVSREAQVALSSHTYGLEGYIKDQLSKKFAKHIADNIDLIDIETYENSLGDLNLKARIFIARV
jgi:hypothetical protein